MSNPTTRSITISSVSVDSTAADSTEINISDFTSGVVYVPAGSSITSFAVHASPTSGGTFLALDDKASTAISQTVGAGQSIALHDEIFGARFIKLVPDADGTVDITLKGS